MRIGINASFLRKPGTGIGQVTVNFIQKLTESTINNQQSTFVLYTEEPVDMKLPNNFQVRSFLPFWKRDDLVRKVLWEQQVAKEAEKDGCDAFISLYQCSTVFQNSKIKNPKSSIFHTIVVHDVIPRIFPEYQGNMRQRFHWRLVERALCRADAIVAVSESTQHDLVEFGVPSERITVAYPDVSPSFRQDLSLEEENRVMATYGLVPGYLYHGGGLEIRKNTEGLLRAYKQVTENTQLEVPPLVISGKIHAESNPLATPVRTLIRELGLEKRVRLLGFVPEQDLPALYKNALFFVYPSLYEGFGLPILEALCMKTPVLTADNSSLTEVAGDAALYIDAENIDSLASGMERLLSDALLRQRLSNVTIQERARFEWSHFVEHVLDRAKDPTL